MHTNNYKGKAIYLGIDVHKKSYSCVGTCEGKVIKSDRMPAKPDILLRYLQNNFIGARIYTAYEAGFSGFHLHRFLTAQNINNIVVHPGSIEIAARDRVKTDKRDARKISQQLYSGRLRGIFVPTQGREEMRCLTRLREDIIQSRHRSGMQFKSLLFTQGLIDCDEDAKISRVWMQAKIALAREKGFSEDFCYCLTTYANQWLEQNKRLIEIGQKFKDQVKEEIGLQTIYESVPGIGLIHGRQLANELGDMTQFKNERSLFSYTGLTPSEFSSGEHKRQGHITRQGHARIRKILVEASWIAIEQDPNLKGIFDRISLRRGKKRAIVAIARRLVGRIRSCVLTGTLYEIKSTREVCSDDIANSMTSSKDPCVMK